MNRKIQMLVIASTLILFAACGSTAAQYNNQGNNEFEDENYDEALEKYNAAKLENPDLAEPYYNSGNAFHRQGNLDAAGVQTKQSIRTAKRNDNDEVAQGSYYNLGNNFFEGGNLADAVESYKEALRIKPDDQDAKYNLELAMQEQQQQEQEQQQQQQGGGGQPPPPGQENQEDSEGGQGEQPNQGQGENEDQEDGGGGQPDQDQPGQSGSQDQPQDQGGQRGLTPQEAERLLDALGQDSQTLQERLQEGFFAPGLPPSEDW